MLLQYQKHDRSVAQLVERRSPKPEVAGSMPVAPATFAWRIKIRLYVKKVKGV